MRYIARIIAAALALLALAAACYGIAALSLGGSPAPAAHAAPAAPAAPALAAAPAAPSAQPAPQPAAWTPQEQGFFADLFDGQATDLAPQQATDLLATARRICDLRQPRADWLASLTSGPQAMSAAEAGKLIDTAMASFCPAAWTAARAAAPAPHRAAPRPATASHRAPAARPAAARPTPAAQPTPLSAPNAGLCPVGQEWQGTALGCVQPQLPEETQGRAIDPLTDPCYRQDPECYASAPTSSR